MAGDEVRAAGGVVVRRRAGRAEVLVIHRPRDDDWSFPKGKLDDGESWRDAAVREVREETGLVVSLRDELPEVRYRDRHDRPKRVRYWVAEVVEDDGFEAGDEVDERRWVRLDRVDRELSYAHDRALVEALAADR